MSVKNPILNSLVTAWKGLKVTLDHVFHSGKKRKPQGVAEDNYFKQQEGLVTIQYPREKIQVPETGRYQLHVEIDDCIVCNLYATICLVDCIDIRSDERRVRITRVSTGRTRWSTYYYHKNTIMQL